MQQATIHGKKHSWPTVNKVSTIGPIHTYIVTVPNTTVLMVPPVNALVIRTNTHLTIR